jgi:CBS domain-containing protein
MNISEVMATNVVTLDATSTAVEAARMMKDRDIGDVVVRQDDGICGIVTDRDIVVRAVAEAKDPQSVTLADICSHDLVTLAPTDSVSDAVRVMSERAVRRLPVVENGKAVGIVTLGDLAVERDPDSALADISEAPPND